MKNFISNPEKKKALNSLTIDEQKALKSVIEELQTFLKKPLINDIGYKTINNSFRQLEMYKENYTERYIRLLKQGHSIT